MSLPRAKDNTRPPDILAALVTDPIERVTYLLRRGDAISDRDCAYIERLISRLEALRDAYEFRTSLVEKSE